MIGEVSLGTPPPGYVVTYSGGGVPYAYLTRRPSRFLKYRYATVEPNAIRGEVGIGRHPRGIILPTRRSTVPTDGFATTTLDGEEGTQTAMEKLRSIKSSIKLHQALLVALVALSLCVFGGGCSMKQDSLPQTAPAVFSWNTTSLDQTSFLEKLGVRTVFQEVAAGDDAQVLEALSEFDVYLLTGDPNMELEQMKEAVLRARQGYAGLVLDVEPYGGDAWSTEQNREAILNTYCDQMEQLYAYAQEQSVELVLCIPYWYDDLGFAEQLERIVKSCDGICVMNYSRGNEQGNIQSEYELAQKYCKKLWTAYELTQSDGEGVLESNTYHDQGIRAVTDNYSKYFSNTGIGLAYHDLDSVREATE